MTGASSDPPPVPPTASVPGVLSGCALTGMMHLVVSFAIIIIGGAVAREGFWVVFIFWIFLGVLQWIYLYPAIRFSRSRGWPGIVLGMWIGGGMTLLIGLAQFGLNALPVAMEKITGNSPPNTVYSGADSQVVSTDGTHLVVRPGLGTSISPLASGTETYLLEPATKIGFLGPAWQMQDKPADRSWFTAGRHVTVDYVLKKHERVAERVTIWVEKKEAPPPDAK
jgi:hypothetical protein